MKYAVGLEINAALARAAEERKGIELVQTKDSDDRGKRARARHA
jgi:hypothetical protein